MGPPIFGKMPAREGVSAAALPPSRYSSSHSYADSLEKAFNIPLPTAGDDAEDSVATLEEPNKCTSITL